MKPSTTTYSNSIRPPLETWIITKNLINSYSYTDQIWRYLSDRTGIICYANLPILWMFSGRNNIFLWATGWEFSTFNTFHRNIARVAVIEAIIHSVGWSVIEWHGESCYSCV